MVINFISYNFILIMNKLLKYILVGIAIISTGIACFSSADSVGSLLTTNNITVSNLSSSWKTVLYCGDYITQDSTMCFKASSDNYNGTMGIIIGTANGNNINPYNQLNYYLAVSQAGNYVCMAVGPSNYVRLQSRDSAADWDVEFFSLNGFLGTDLPLMTSLQCQTNYNLIPIENVTANYCRLNFDLISPLECPMNEGTGGTTQWTAWYINNQQYPGTSMLRITIPDYIAYSTTYNQDDTIVEIEGIDADQEYIENIINNEKLTPTNEDFANMLTGITAFIPYLFIGLLFFRFVRIINKIWK